MAGQEGFEPTTHGFGIRCSTVGATALRTLYLPSRCERVLTAEFAEFFEFKLVCRLLLILGGRIILTFALGAIETHDDSHNYFLYYLNTPAFSKQGEELYDPPLSRNLLSNSTHCYRFSLSRTYSMISATTPAPTVRPPSRIAKRSSFSIAIGVINSTSIATLSPGITISTFAGKIHDAGHVRGTEVELRTIPVEERSMAAAFFLGQNVSGTFKLLVRGDGAGVSQNLAAFHFFLFDAAKKSADVVAGLTLIEKLTEHFNAGDDCLAGRA